MTGYVSARQIVAALKGRWGRNSGTCCCPAHDDRTPSLSVSIGHGGLTLVHCHGGCSQPEVIAALQARGLWGDRGAEQDPAAPWNYIPRDRPPADPEMRTRALQLWERSKPANGTLVETYLRARGIRTPMSPALRFHPGVRHSPDNSVWPCMVARLEDDRGFACVQRTYLSRDGSGKAPVEGPKRTLGAMGGSAVRLRPAPDEGILGLAEGIESALSAAQLYSLPVWASLSAVRLSLVEIPATVAQVTIFADAGDVGRNAAFAAADSIERRGFVTDVIFPAAHFRGGCEDFNAVLQGGGHGQRAG